MWYSIVFCFLVCAYAAPPTEVVPLEKQQPTVIPIVSQSEELEPNGTFKYSYETGNGIKREEISYDKVVPKVQGRSASSNEGGESGESDEIHVQQGSYSYTAPDGTVISVRYIADENGFQPIGDHIPRVAPISQSAPGSSEKRGRAFKVKDNSEAASAPAIVARSGPAEEYSTKSESSTKSASSELTSSNPESSQAEVKSTTSSSSENEPSTTAAASETTKLPEATTSSEVSESTTTAAPSTTEVPELSSTASSSEASSTETSTTVAA